MNVDIMYNFLTYNITLFTIQLEFNVIHILITSIIYKYTCCNFAKLMWRTLNGEAYMHHSQKLMIKVDR